MKASLLEMSGMLGSEYDGITHIRVGPHGRTLLGRRLSNMSSVGFVHPLYGEVSCMEAFWVFCRGGKRHAELLTHSPKEASKWLKRTPRISYPAFRKDILEALRCKLEQSDEITQALIATKLPLIRWLRVEENEVYVIDEQLWCLKAIEDYRTEQMKHTGTVCVID